MKTIKGPALFLAQFMGDDAPFNSFESIVEWAASIGYKGVQIPSWDGRCMDLERAANDQSQAVSKIAASSVLVDQLLTPEGLELLTCALHETLPSELETNQAGGHRALGA